MNAHENLLVVIDRIVRADPAKILPEHIEEIRLYTELRKTTDNTLAVPQEGRVDNQARIAVGVHRASGGVHRDYGTAPVEKLANRLVASADAKIQTARSRKVRIVVACGFCVRNVVFGGNALVGVPGLDHSVLNQDKTIVWKNTSLAVTNVGWSGAGYFVTGKVDGFEKIAKLNEPGYYFHIAYKGAANVAHACYITWGDGNLYRFVLGQGQTEVEGVMTQALKPINNDGAFVANEWNEYEFSLAEAGVDFTHTLSTNADGVPGSNIFCFLSGGNAGTVINLDAAFFYKK